MIASYDGIKTLPLNLIYNHFSRNEMPGLSEIYMIEVTLVDMGIIYQHQTTQKWEWCTCFFQNIL